MNTHHIIRLRAGWNLCLNDNSMEKFQLPATQSMISQLDQTIRLQRQFHMPPARSKTQRTFLHGSQLLGCWQILVNHSPVAFDEKSGQLSLELNQPEGQKVQLELLVDTGSLTNSDNAWGNLWLEITP